MFLKVRASSAKDEFYIEVEVYIEPVVLFFELKTKFFVVHLFESTFFVAFSVMNCSIEDQLNRIVIRAFYARGVSQHTL